MHKLPLAAILMVSEAIHMVASFGSLQMALEILYGLRFELVDNLYFHVFLASTRHKSIDHPGKQNMIH